MKALKAHQSYLIFDLKLFSKVYNIHVSKRKVCTQATKDVALIVTLQEKYSIRQEHVYDRVYCALIVHVWKKKQCFYD